MTSCPIDPMWSHGSYEDYEWFWRVTKAGYAIRVCRDLFGWHHHRRGLRALAKEYRRSSRGCAYFIRAHRHSPLAKRRLRQAIILPLVAIMAAVGVVAAVAEGYTAALAGLVLGCTAVLAVHQLVRSRNLESVAYPAVGLALGMVFTTGLVTNLIRPGSGRAAEFRHPVFAVQITGEATCQSSQVALLAGCSHLRRADRPFPYPRLEQHGLHR